MKNILFRINELSKEKATGLTVDENKNNKCYAKTIQKHFVEA